MKTGNTNLHLAKLAIFIKKRHDGKNILHDNKSWNEIAETM